MQALRDAVALLVLILLAFSVRIGPLSGPETKAATQAGVLGTAAPTADGKLLLPAWHGQEPTRATLEQLRTAAESTGRAVRFIRTRQAGQGILVLEIRLDEIVEVETVTVPEPRVNERCPLQARLHLPSKNSC